MKNTIIILLVIIILIYVSQIRADTIIDTTYSVPEMDGCIDYNTYWNTYYVDTLCGLMVGDFWDALFSGNCYVRSFVSFPIPETPEGYELDSSFMYIYQSASFGNYEPGVFPIWDMQSGSYEVPCYLDHVDYGLYLDVGDFNSGVLEYHIGDISETPEIGWRNLEITQCVVEDIQAEREYSQYRLRFPINTDYDNMDDWLNFASGEATTLKPYIRFVFTDLQGVNDNEACPKKDRITIYPNPVRNNFTIEFEISKQKRMQISLYNVRGERVKSIYNCFTNTRKNSFTIETDNLLSGVYFIRIDNGDVNLTRKILVIR